MIDVIKEIGRYKEGRILYLIHNNESTYSSMKNIDFYNRIAGIYDWAIKYIIFPS